MSKRSTNIAICSTSCALARAGRITLVFAAHDELHNDAVVLRDIVLGRRAA